MAESNKKWVVRRNQLKFSYEALYREVAAYFNLPPTAVWILYTLMDTDGEIAQQDLGEQWNFPKQTINSVIQNLNRDGYLTLTVIPGTRNRKAIRLTEQGKELANQTAKLLAEAEERAAAHLTEEERTQYLSLSAKFYNSLIEETKLIRR
ncbi:MAG: winged helix-turn-helix transcriptional regulator [Lachnospiraceae bacterium]|nr:winged helix-turn-helix transcriptional regulator [Lachnospiraceae bacterium]